MAKDEMYLEAEQKLRRRIYYIITEKNKKNEFWSEMQVLGSELQKKWFFDRISLRKRCAFEVLRGRLLRDEQPSFN